MEYCHWMKTTVDLKHNGILVVIDTACGGLFPIKDIEQTEINDKVCSLCNKKIVIDPDSKWFKKGI